MLPHLFGSQASFDRFLTSVLQIVILLDFAGLVAYVLLSGIRSSRQRKGLAAAAAPATSARTPLRGLLWRRSALASTGPAAPSLDLAYADLRRVLDSYHEGLA
jgi:hypothetical protein